MTMDSAGWRYAVADDVAWVDAADLPRGNDEPVAWVCRAADPHPRELRDWAWLIWQCAVEGGTVDEITAAVAEARSLPGDGSVNVSEFLEELEQFGLLVRA